MSSHTYILEISPPDDDKVCTPFQSDKTFMAFSVDDQILLPNDGSQDAGKVVLVKRALRIVLENKNGDITDKICIFTKRP